MEVAEPSKRPNDEIAGDAQLEIKNRICNDEREIREKEMETCLANEGDSEVETSTHSPSNSPIYEMKMDHTKQTQHI